MTKEFRIKFMLTTKTIGGILLISAGVLLHLLTAFTLKSYYGSVWGGISLVFPVISEMVLVAIQLKDEMYNYPMILTSFTILILLITTINLNINRISNLMFKSNR